ncbi:MAG TPA: TonB family protein [Candidatus Binatia bacterium]|jgi:TonB family protein
MFNQTSAEWGDLSLFSLFRSPFLIPSVLFHTLLFLLALRAATLPIAKTDDTPISVQLVEIRDGGSTNKSIGSGKGPGGPRALPKLGTPAPPTQRVGKLDSGSVEASVPSTSPVETAPPPKPVPLPGPKVLAAESRTESVNAKETSADSLVRLPTKESPTNPPGSGAADLATHQRSLAALKGAGEGPGIKALKEGTQVPGALRGSGTNPGAYGVPGGSQSGSGLAGNGTGVGAGGGSTTGLKGLSSADYNQYLGQLKKRVEAVWKYPDGVSGVQKVAILFTLDRAGRLVRSEVLDSTDARLNASAVEAMKRASPFPPIPESLKDLANTPLRMQFTVTIGVRG